MDRREIGGAAGGGFRGMIMAVTAIEPSKIATPPQTESARRIGVWPLIGLFLFSLCIRAIVGSYLGFNSKLESDEPEYFNPAVSIAEGNGYCMVPQQSLDGIPRLTAYRMPGPALILALIFKIFGPSIHAARWTSAVAGALAAPLMYLFARQFTTQPVALLSGIACSLHPAWTYTAQSIASEPFFVPGFLLSLWLTIKAFRSGSWLSFAAGLAWGITAFMRPHALPIAGMVTLLAIWRGRWSVAALLALGVATALVPWGVRNFTDFHRFYMLGNESGETFLGANNPYVLSNPALHGMWIPPTRVSEYRQRLSNVHDEFERRDVQNAIARRFLRQHPESIPRLAIYKLWRWVTPVTVSGGAIRAMVLASYGSLLLLLAVGVPLGVFKRSLPLDLAMICTLVFFVMTVVYWGDLTRGRMPLEIIWIPWAASALFMLLPRGLKESCSPLSA